MGQIQLICTSVGTALAGAPGTVIGAFAGEFLDALFPDIAANLFAERITDSTAGLIKQIRGGNDKIINHDLQRAFRQAFREAIHDMGGKECFKNSPGKINRPDIVYFETGEGQNLSRVNEPLKRQICGCLHEMETALDKFVLLPLESIQEDSIVPIVSNLKYADNKEISEAFFDRVVTPFLNGYHSLLIEAPGFEPHLRKYLLRRTLLHFGELLKSEEYTRAWRAFNRLLLEDLRDEVQRSGARQEDISRELNELDEKMGQSFDNLNDEMAEVMERFGSHFDSRFDDLIKQGIDQYSEIVELRKEVDKIYDLIIKLGGRLPGETRVDARQRLLEFLIALGKLSRGNLLESSEITPESDILDKCNKIPFVGRENELQRISEAFDACVSKKKPKFVMVEGRWGEGKTTLVREFVIRKAATGTPFWFIWTKCADETKDEERGAFKRIFNSLIDLSKRLLPVDSSNSSIIEHAPAWVDGLIPHTQDFQSIKYEKEEYFNQFLDLLMAICQNQNLVIVLEDIQWADIPSLYLLISLMHYLEQQSITFICDYRVEEFKARFDATLLQNFYKALTDKHVLRIEVGTAINVSEYVCCRYPGLEIPPQLVKKIQDMSDGLPLFIDQLFELWEGEPKIISSHQEGGKQVWQFSQEDIDNIQVPRLISDVLQTRIEGMNPEIQETLRVASVQGEDFAAQIVADLMQIAMTQTGSDLDKLIANYHFIKEDHKDGIGKKMFEFYRFVHRFFRDHIHDTIEPNDKKDLHRRVAEYIETILSTIEGSERSYDVLERWDGQLFRHYRESVLYNKAVEYGLKTAQEASINYHWFEAAKFANETLKLIAEYPSIFDHQTRISYKAQLANITAISAFSTGQVEEAIVSIKSVIEELRAFPDQKKSLAVLLNSLANIYYDINDEEAEDIAREAISIYQELGDKEGIYDAKCQLDDILQDNSCSYIEGEKLTLEILSMAQEMGDLKREITAEMELGWLLVYMGRGDEGVEHCSHAIDVYKKQYLASHLKNPDNHAWNMRIYGYSLSKQGEYEKALSIQKEAMETYKNIKTELRVVWVKIEIGLTLAGLGKYEEAIRCYRECIQFSNSIDNPIYARWSEMNWAQLELERGNLDDAWHHLEESKRYMNDCEEPDDVFELDYLKARYYFQKEEFQKALTFLAKALHFCEKFIEKGWEFQRMRAFELQAKILQGMKNYKKAESGLTQLLDQSSNLKNRLWQATLYQDLGFLNLEIGKKVKAKKFLEKSLELYKSLGHNQAIPILQETLDSL